jgi:23S rRNA (cytidine1920-2'-O)/16S rRNA (cytidine1409-2'-O)-methyltransferase
MAGSRRVRLDVLLVERGLADNRSRAQSLLMAGRVTSEGVRLEKPGLSVAPSIPLAVSPGRVYVGRGGHKLVHAVERFGIVADNLDALDVGASTGGFTQVLLEAGARRVVALDVGHGQLDWGLRNDPRVVVVEGLNARHLKPEDLAFPPVLVTVDVSFISLLRVLPAIVRCLEPGGEIVALIKPQFEVGRRHVGRGGIVRDPQLHHRTLIDLTAEFLELGWGITGLCASRLRGADGNREFFVHLHPHRPGHTGAALDHALESALLEDELDP